MSKKLPPYQQRVIDEKKELDARLLKLTADLSNPEDSVMLTDVDKDLLRQQHDAMSLYSRILGYRTRGFLRAAKEAAEA